MSADIEKTIEKTIQAERGKNTITIERVRNGFIVRSHSGWFVYTDLEQLMHKIKEQLSGKANFTTE